MRRGTRAVSAALVVGAAACASAATATASTPILLPSVRTTLTPGPPLTSPATGAETVYPPGMTSDEQVHVGIDDTGKPVSVDAVQRLDLSHLGDYSFIVPGPITDVQEAPGSDSEPGLRRGAVIWAGFSPGHKTLASRVTLQRSVVAPLLPLRVTLNRVGSTLLVRGQNTSSARAPLLVGSMSAAETEKALRATQRTLAKGVAAPDVYANVLRTPVAQSVTVASPLDVRGKVGDTSFHYILGDGRPLDFTQQIPNAPPDAKVRLVVTPLPPLRLLRSKPGDPAENLALVSRVRLILARELQYQTLLANPNPTGRSTAAYVYETAKRTAIARPIAPAHNTSGTWPTILAAALGVLGLGGLVVLWAH